MRAVYGMFGAALCVLLPACSGGEVPDSTPNAGGTGGTGGALAGAVSAGAPSVSDGGSMAGSAEAGAPSVAGATTSGAGGIGGGAGAMQGSGAGGAGGAAALALAVGFTGSAANKTATRGKLNIGQEFTVTEAGVHLRDLGVWDSGADGLVAEHVVTVFSLGKLGLNPGASATPIIGGTVTVPVGKAAPLEQGFRFAALPRELELPLGNYAVVAYGMSDAGDPAGDGGNVPFSGSGISDGGFSVSQSAAAPSPAFPSGGDTNAHASASFRFTSPQSSFIRIMPLGASITDGQHGTDAGYRGPLQALLQAAHFNAQLVGSATDNFGSLPADQRHHEGHSGYTIQGLQDNVNHWLGPTGSPADLVLLLVGTNDIVFNTDAQLADAGKRLSKLISTICAKDTGLLPHARIIVAQLPPLKPADWAKRDVAYNAQVAQVVADHAKLGEAVTLVDMYHVVSLDDLFTDGEHPVDSGYIKMAHAWFSAISAH